MLKVQRLVSVFVAFLGLFTTGAAKPQVDDDCRTLTFKSPIEDTALKGHVFKNLTTNRASECEMNCFLEHDCVSLNYEQQDNGTFWCELSDSDHNIHPEDLQSRNGFQYTPVKNLCSSNPCPSNSRCQAGFTDKEYRCVCHDPGYTGDNCSIDVDECTDELHNCSQPYECKNVIGSFNCRLPPPIWDEYGGGWVALWWWTAHSTWPSDEKYTFGKPFGQCSAADQVCFGRLPEFLHEDQTELLAADSEGTVYRWRFDSSNDVAHAAWKAFYMNQTTQHGEVKHSSHDWNPVALNGSAPERDQNSFMYRSEHGVMSLLLDDDNCDCFSSLNIGHGMCYAGHVPKYSVVGQIGVDRLYDVGCSIGGNFGPKAEISLTLYFREVGP